MANAKHKALQEKKKGSYSFLTKGGFRVDAPGSTTGEAYRVARSKNKHYEKNSKIGAGKLSGTYFKYNKEGLHANEGPYYQHRPSKFKKANEH